MSGRPCMWGAYFDGCDCSDCNAYQEWFHGLGAWRMRLVGWLVRRRFERIAGGDAG